MIKNIFTFEAMTTPCEVVIYHNDKVYAKNIAMEILQNTKALEVKYNYFDSNSLLSKINNREISDLDPQTLNLLKLAKSFYRQTEQVFDVTIATIKPLFQLSSLDDFNNEKNKIIQFVGCDHFEFKRNRIVFDNVFTKIDLGGMVKEYAVDEAVKILKKRKVASAIVNFGGDLYTLGKKPDGQKFTVGIKNPKNPNEHILYKELQDMALVTSASYERNYTIENNTFSHIISKNINASDIISATVIAPSVLQAGVISTSLMINDKVKTKFETYKIDKELKIH